MTRRPRHRRPPAAAIGRTLAAWTGLLLVGIAHRLPTDGLVFTPDTWEAVFYLAGGALIVAAIAPALDAPARAAIASVVTVALWSRAAAELAAIPAGRPLASAIVAAASYPLLAGFVVYLMATWPHGDRLPSDQ